MEFNFTLHSFRFDLDEGAMKGKYKKKKRRKKLNCLDIEKMNWKESL